MARLKSLHLGSGKLLTVLILAVLVGLFALYVRWEKQIDAANERRQQSLLLADELRQSSDDLTRMVRRYVATGNPLYKRQFQEILDIRNGVSPRPLNYTAVYWDLVGEDDQRPSPFGPAVPFLDLLRQAGFSEAEFEKMAQAKVYSDELTKREYDAMALIEAHQPVSAATRVQAMSMLFDERYHAAKARIMRPIREFELLADERTLQAVRLAEKKATLMRMVFILFALVVLGLEWRSAHKLRTLLGALVDVLREQILRLGRGESLDEVGGVDVMPTQANSVMGWLLMTQRTLQQQEVERRRLEAELRNLAFQDALTGLPNRRLFLDRLQQAMHASARSQSHLAILFIDLDHFKQVNDLYGHDAGDLLLRAVARALLDHVRQSDTVARLGGDEFVVILEQLGSDAARAQADAEAVASTLRLALNTEYALGEVRYQNAASIGIALCLGDQTSPAKVLNRADEAMYLIKHGFQQFDRTSASERFSG